jgi:hypothetical protein
MTDLDILSSLDSLERLLAGSAGNPDAAAINAWHASFRQALAQAEHGPRWPEIQARGKALGLLLDEQVSLLRTAMARVRRELELGTKGRRALQAYRATRI